MRKFCKLVIIASLTAAPVAFSVTGTVLADVNTTSNLAQGVSVQTNVTGVYDNLFNSYESSYSGDITGTTDWRGFCRQGGRDIIIQLPQTSAIDSISLQFEQVPEQGIHYPGQVDFEVNQNGLWYLLGTARSSLPSTDTRDTVQTFQIKLHHMGGKEFKIHFPVGVWVFARNLRVTGASGDSGNSGSVNGLAPSPQYLNAPMHPTDLRDADIHNMLLVYTGGFGAQGLWSESDFLPMVAYQPQTGPVTGRMFDTMLFLPYGTVPATQAGWTTYLQDLFSPNQQLAALDAAVAQQNQALGTPYFRENVVLTIPYSVYGNNEWGNVSGEELNFGGSPTDPFALTAREKAISWYLKSLMADWEQAGYTHLHLDGIYWDNETFQNSSPGEADLIQSTVSLVHQHQLPLLWIPFYGAYKTEDWQQIGFDAAWLQPNFVEQGETADITRIQNAELQATETGTGIELELNGFEPTDETLYQESLQQFAADGFGQNVSHAFYDGSKMLLYAANATDDTTRALYDNTYSFMNHS